MITPPRRRCGSTTRCEEELRIQDRRLADYAKKMEDSFASVMSLIASLVEIRDAYTFGHSLRVSHLSCALARRLGYLPEVVVTLGNACLMHDVGKIRTSDAILLKPGRLSEEEMRIMQRHPEDGAEILSRLPAFRKYLSVVRSHHERFDGLGYPAGLRGESIPALARITAIADSYDAMTTNRPYREAKTVEEALEEITACLESQFDPMMGSEFVQMLEVGGVQ